MINRIRTFIRKRIEKRKQRSRLHRFANRLVMILGGCYLLLAFFPHPVFAYSTEVGPFQIHSDRPIPREIEDVLALTRERVENSPLFEAGDRFPIFLAADPWRRRLLNPRASRAFGAAFVMTGNTVLNRTDIPANTCFNDRKRYNQRLLHEVIAHECTHHLLARRLGLLRYLRLPHWKNEGYCEYVAGGSTFSEAKGLELLKAGRADDAPAFRYLTYRLATTHHLEHLGKEPQEFLETKLDLDASLNAFVATRSRSQ
ncbi:MAG: hypothetical protein AAGD07_12845 [Planctomycetota bacterium]